MPYVFDHTRPRYLRQQSKLGTGKNNGAFHYSIEIVKNIIPNVKTNRSWVTVNSGECENGAIVFIHNNKEVERAYGWLRDYKDLVLVCSTKRTCELCDKLKLGTTVYLPLSVDVAEVEKYKVAGKTKEACYVGNMWSWKTSDLIRYVPRGTQYLTNLSRDELLTRLATFKVAYAIGRCAIEAKILGCEVRTCDSRYPDPNMWQVLDNKDAAKMLQKALNKIDGRKGYQREQLVIDTTNPTFIRKNEALKSGRFNGAYYYSQEIVKNIIPNVKTERAWDTLTMRAIGTVNGAICFLHQCIEMDKAYDWLKDYEDLVLVVSSPYVYDWAVQNGYKAIYLPLSIDTEYVKQFKKKRRTKNACFCGNIWKFREQEIAETIPDDVDFQPPNICREDLLKFMSDYKYVYAIGRCALEAQALGAKILQCYKKFSVEHWKLIDNKEAAKMLQVELDKIDGIVRKR